MKLSICIPIDDQKELFKEFLQSIHHELCEHVELIICDNASNDGSELIARDFVKSASRTLYYTFSKKVDLAHHLTETLDLASGEYCWLLQPGDLLKKGAIQAVLTHLEKSPELTGLSMNAVCTESTPWPFLLPKSDRTYQNIKSCLGDLLPYLNWSSAHIALRKSWLLELKNGTVFKEKILPFSLAKMMIQKPYWNFLSTPLIQLKQAEADSPEFEKTALNCANSIALLLGSRNPLYFRVLSGLCEGALSIGLQALRTDGTLLAGQTLQKMFKCYWPAPAFWLHQFPFLLAEHPFVNKALSFYLRLRKKGRA